MSFISQSDESIKNIFEKNNFKSFAIKQINNWIYNKKVSSFHEMTNLSFNLREFLSKNFKLYSLKLKTVQVAKNKQTKKYLFKLEDGYFIESVLILSEKRTTICVSSQVGCEVRCTFCASGKKGFFRNLKAHEILEQILLIARDLNENPTHIVFMGMGEPLLNLENVIRAIKTISDEKYLNISKRRITISTVGIVEGIDQLRKENLKINLCLSLHSPDDETRRKIIPYSKKYSIDDILISLKEYFDQTKRDVSFEYILIEDVNDSLEHAKKLARLLTPFQGSINLIPYNPIKGINYKKSNYKNISIFKSYLISRKLNVTQRYTKGDDISAACGQLAFKK